jgi:signal transduction histidine kinase
VPPEEDRTFSRVLRLTGLLTLAMVCLPVFAHGPIDRARFAAWIATCAVFAASIWVSAAAAAHGWRAALLVVEVACVVAMVLLLCDGFEGALLVLVALQLGRVLGWRAGAAVISAQTLLLAGAIAAHWTPGAALLLAPPYLGFQAVAFGFSRLLRREEEARREVASVNAELVVAKTVAEENTRLAERLRIARDLHDAVGHRLTALRLHLETAARTTEGTARDACVTAQALAGEALADVRAAVSSFRDGERIDLVTAIHAMAAEIPMPRVHVSTPPALVCGDATRGLALLRCAQEIITNAARHASAKNLWIDVVQKDGAVEIVAKDDGRGADEVSPGAGLRGMRERIEQTGGQLDVATAPGAGFTLRAKVPLEAT